MHALSGPIPGRARPRLCFALFVSFRTPAVEKIASSPCWRVPGAPTFIVVDQSEPPRHFLLIYLPPQQESPPQKVVLSRIQLTLHATRPTPHALRV